MHTVHKPLGSILNSGANLLVETMLQIGTINTQQTISHS